MSYNFQMTHSVENYEGNAQAERHEFRIEASFSEHIISMRGNVVEDEDHITLERTVVIDSDGGEIERLDVESTNLDSDQPLFTTLEDMMNDYEQLLIG